MAVLGLLGLIVSPLAELLIARLLPRLGGLPAPHVRITAAAVTGALCTAFALRFGNDPVLPAFVLLAVMGVQLARIDISLHLLPNPLVLLLVFAGAFLLASSALAGSPWSYIARAAAGGAILFVAYLLLAIISPGAVGLGDVKLAAPLGLYLGYLGWMHLLYGALLGFVLNGIFAAAVAARKRPDRASEVAHGPSMVAAVALVSLLLA
ncbi:prepilin peptidase [Arthrobacter sp. B6]|uniref:prepilin peptidase n=1 Tax=Arthrobacter sp. B6 TaxID=1570137 RepID=UPI001E363792|nr:prepilin peptidase [Arthrobacter sp. B6]